MKIEWIGIADKTPDEGTNVLVTKRICRQAVCDGSLPPWAVLAGLRIA